MPAAEVALLSSEYSHETNQVKKRRKNTKAGHDR
jgi:hypothetical protein